MITYNKENVKMPPLKRRKITKWIKTIISSYDKKLGEVGYMFVNDEKILQVNKDFLHHDYYTDIITFDYSEENVINGDIIISIDTVRSNSKVFDKDFLEELQRVIIHGILHLCGINDKTKEEAKQMRKAEDKALALLGEL